MSLINCIPFIQKLRYTTQSFHPAIFFCRKKTVTNEWDRYFSRYDERRNDADADAESKPENIKTSAVLIKQVQKKYIWFFEMYL